MQRYVVNDDLKLDDSDIKHIINVMRGKIKDKFGLVNNNILYTCEITSIDKKKISYDIISKENIEIKKEHKIILAVSLIKEQKMDFILQKATELGVDEIIPIVTDRTIIKIDNKKDNKIIRWKKILKESTEQSHRSKMPELVDIIDLKELIKKDFDLKMFCNTQEMSKNIKKVLQDNKKSDTIVIVVGPEGGLTNNEIELLINNNYISTSLGNNILRAETVPLYLLSVINYEFMR